MYARAVSRRYRPRDLSNIFWQAGVSRSSVKMSKSPVSSSITINVFKKRSSSEEPDDQNFSAPHHSSHHSLPISATGREGSAEPDLGSLSKKRMITKIEARPHSEADLEAGFDVDITTLSPYIDIDYKRASGLMFDYREDGEHSDHTKFWIEVQRKTFTNWVNNKLEGTGFFIEDIQQDFGDGRALMALIQQLVPGSLTM